MQVFGTTNKSKKSTALRNSQTGHQEKALKRKRCETLEYIH